MFNGELIVNMMKNEKLKFIESTNENITNEFNTEILPRRKYLI